MSDIKLSSRLEKPDILSIGVDGPIDAHTFEKLEKLINAAFNKRIFKIVVNLERVNYISSAGAGVFIGALSKTQENQGNIVLLNPTEQVMQVFDLLGLSLIFTVAKNMPEALQAFN